MKKTLLFIVCIAQIFTICADGGKQKRNELRYAKLKKQLATLSGRIKVYPSLLYKPYSSKARALILKKLCEDAMKGMVIATFAEGMRYYIGGKRWIVNAIPVEEVRRKARELRSRGEAIYYRSIFRHGYSIQIPESVSLESHQAGLFSGESDNQFHIGDDGAFVATYEMGDSDSNNYMRVRAAFPEVDQALEFVRRMDRIITERGFSVSIRKNSVTLGYSL